MLLRRIMPAVLLTLVVSMSARAGPRSFVRRHRAWTALAALSLASATTDIAVTAHQKAEWGGYETDPLARPMVDLPNPAFVTLGVALTGAFDLACLKVSTSRHAWLRHVWWMPLAAQIEENARGAAWTATH